MSGLRVLLSAAIVALLAVPAWADRTPSVRSPGLKVSPAQDDIRVPYLTTGSSAFGAYRVAPRVYSSPAADNPANPGARPAFNLPFYGGRMGFGYGNNGAIPKPTLLPSNAK
jgi:hypothetical protein